jgi:hypothetical protein
MDPLRGEMARAFGGGQTRTYTGTGPLPDPQPFVKGGSVGFDFSLQPSSAPITGSPINGTNGYRYSPNAAGGYTRVGKIDPNLPPPLPAPAASAPSGGNSIENIASLPPSPSIMGRDITANTMPGADLASLGVPASVNVPRYIEVQKRVPVPSAQPIETGDGVHWDADLAQYVLDSPAPAPAPTYRTVTTKVPNPAYVPPPLPRVPAPVVPLSPPPEELAALRQNAQNPLQRLFGATPLGHVVNFAQTLGQAPHYGAPATGGLLAMLTGRGGVGGAAPGGLLGLLSGHSGGAPSLPAVNLYGSNNAYASAGWSNPSAMAQLSPGGSLSTLV